MAHRKIGEVLWLTLQYAKRDRLTLAAAYYDDERAQAVKDAHRDIKDIERLQVRLFGTTKSEREAKIAKMKPVDIVKLLDEIQAE